MTNTFKHSGTFGDIVYSMPLVKHFGGGEYYLHLNQIDYLTQHFYGGMPSPFHQGRMNMNDFNYMKSFMEAQDYISKFKVLDPQQEITHNLDRFRQMFVGHPGNYVDIYSHSMGLRDTALIDSIRTSPWLTVPQPRIIENKPVVINRTDRWLPNKLSPQWAAWKNEGMERDAIFVGLPQEYETFKRTMGWDIPYQNCPTMLDLAEIIAGAGLFIGNQSVALSIAIGLGVEVACEQRTDLPLERNECYFHNASRVNYFSQV